MAFRRGQWVKTTRDLSIQAEAAGQVLTVTVPAPSVGIHHAPLPGRLYHREGAAPVRLSEDDARAALTAGLCELALVDSETGFTTTLEALVPVDAIEAVLDVTDIPARRRATAPDGWTPRA